MKSKKVMKTGTIAVISGDLVNSSQFEPGRMEEIMTRLSRKLDVLNDRKSDGNISFAISRGDSFQGIVENPLNALKIAIELKAFLNSYIAYNSVATNTSPIADVRISIGIGEASYDLKSINISNGEAFQLSGRILDAMKSKDSKMELTTSNDEINDEFKVHMMFLDSVTDRWSSASAEVIIFLLLGYKERDIAVELNRSQAAINHRKKAAGWDEIQLLLKRYGQVIKQHFV